MVDTTSEHPHPGEKPEKAIPSEKSVNHDLSVEAMNLDIPEINNNDAEQPDPRTIRLSRKAIESRMRRVFEPNVKGEFKVSPEIIKQWKDKKRGRKNLEQVFQSCGFDPDKGLDQRVCLLASNLLQRIVK